MVEDDAAVRRVVVRMLVGAGFRVSEADGFEPAIAIVERDPTVDVLLTDIGLAPGTPQGISIGRMSQYRRVDLKVVFMTGGNADAVTALTQGATTVQKPFNAATLIDAVRSAMPRR